MPYLVGIQADCLPLLRGMALEETVMIDLDRLGSCTPELGSGGDDYFLLPFARELEDVFEVRAARAVAALRASCRSREALNCSGPARCGSVEPAWADGAGALAAHAGACSHMACPAAPLQVVREHIQSPTEFDSTPKCTELLQACAGQGLCR